MNTGEVKFNHPALEELVHRVLPGYLPSIFSLINWLPTSGLHSIVNSRVDSISNQSLTNSLNTESRASTNARLSRSLQVTQLIRTDRIKKSVDGYDLLNGLQQNMPLTDTAFESRVPYLTPSTHRSSDLSPLSHRRSEPALPPQLPGSSPIINAPSSISIRETVASEKALCEYISRMPGKNEPGTKQVAPASMQESVGTIYQDVPVNCDNDNGSLTFNTIPVTRDFEVGATSNENDLIQLNAVWVLLNPHPPGTPIAPVSSRVWTIGHTTGIDARIKLWTTAQKTAIVAAHGTGFFPTVWIEGLEPSRTRTDIIDIEANRFETHKDGYLAIYQLQTVKVTVTPVLDSFTITGLAPHSQGPPNIPANILNGFQAHAYFEAHLYKGSYPVLGTGLKGDPAFIQNLNADTNDLIYPNSSAYAIEYSNDAPERLIAIDSTLQPGPNTDYIFLDKATPPPAPYNDPYYDVEVEISQVTPSPWTVRIRANDAPGIPIRPSNSFITAVGFTRFFWIHIVWKHTDFNEAVTTYPLGYISWYAKFRFVANGTPAGDNTGSQLFVDTLQRTHQIPHQLVPSIVNQGTAFLY